MGHQVPRNSFARGSAYKPIADLLQLHDDLLGQLQRVVPFAEFDQAMARIPKTPRNACHTRWHSIDFIPSSATRVQPTLTTIRQGRRSLSISRSLHHEPVVLHCSPQVISDVAATFCAAVSGSLSLRKEYLLLMVQAAAIWSIW